MSDRPGELYLAKKLDILTPLVDAERFSLQTGRPVLDSIFESEEKIGHECGYPSKSAWAQKRRGHREIKDDELERIAFFYCLDTITDNKRLILSKLRDRCSVLDFKKWIIGSEYGLLSRKWDVSQVRTGREIQRALLKLFLEIQTYPLTISVLRKPVDEMRGSMSRVEMQEESVRQKLPGGSFFRYQVDFDAPAGHLVIVEITTKNELAASFQVVFPSALHKSSLFQSGKTVPDGTSALDETYFQMEPFNGTCDAVAFATSVPLETLRTLNTTEIVTPLSISDLQRLAKELKALSAADNAKVWSGIAMMRIIT
jgi:hypothetical protein